MYVFQHVVLPGVLKRWHGSEAEFEFEGQEVRTLDVKGKKFEEVDAQCLDTSIDDLIRLNSLNENALLHILRGRFSNDAIYTFVSSILIAVNPFRSLGIYGDDTIEKYRSCSDKAQLPPHIYHTTDDVYNSMLTTSKSQSVIISGESGAG